MRQVILSVVAAVALATPALAADLKLKAPPPPAPPPIRGISPSAPASPATTFSAASPNPTISRRPPSTSSRATISRRICNSMQAWRARAFRSRTAPRPRSTATSVSGRPSVPRPRFRWSVLLVPGRQLLQRRDHSHRLRHRLPRERLPAGQRQRHQAGPELLGSLCEGHLHGERPGRLRRLRSSTRRRCSIRAPRAPTCGQREVHRSERRHA